ncbi:unnamed protein product [Paramecium pentaurelia]|uniref:Alpha-type protein kinase domain-containing protein n=1 Tax=Paramecium pentaurelia TaxID=43138 RepID=A0A8S1TGM2_9CILI|nr:unnamed protein product [Paramecium pentaurelia]
MLNPHQQSIKEKESKKKITNLEEVNKYQEEEYEKQIVQNNARYQETIIKFNQERKELEEQIEVQKREIKDQKSKIDLSQFDIANINKTKEKVEQENFDLKLENQLLNDKINQLLGIINTSTLPNRFSTTTRDTIISQPDNTFMNEQINKFREQINKMREDFKNELQQLEKEKNELEKELQKEKEQSNKEHKYFLDEIDKSVSLKKQLDAKNDQIKQLEQQMDNSQKVLTNSNYEIQKLKNQIKDKDFEISSQNENFNLIKQQNEYLKQQLLNQKNSNITNNILQDSKFLELEQELKNLKKNQQEKKDQLQKEREENERQIKERQERDKQRDQKNKQENKKQIEQKFQKAIKERGQLDVCFIVDVTGSMDHYKDQTKMSVQQSLQIIKKATNRDTNWASVCYQDKAELRQLGKYYEFPFSKEQEKLQQFFDNIACDGGGDAAEDIRGAIKQVCKLSWPSIFRIAILICDAPCHGKKYHDGCGDDYPDEDIEDAIQQLIDKNIILIALNFTHHTSKMYKEIQKIYESKKKLELYLYSDLLNINQKDLASIMSRFIGDASQIATQTNKSETKSKEGVKIQKDIRVREGAMEALCKQENFYNFEQQPNVKTVNSKFKVFRVEIKQEQFNKNIQTINNIKCPQDFLVIEEGNWDCIRTEIPFAFGMMKDVFLMKKIKDYSNDLYVIKTPIGSKPYESIDLALKECRSHLICQKLMKKFVDDLQQQKSEKYVNIAIPSVIYSDFLILEESKNSFWIAERFFKGEFVKYNNNYGYINSDDKLELNKFAQSFTYYTYFISGAQYMVCDIQGVGNYFTDPAINTEQGFFDDTDMGIAGQQMYLVNYENWKELLTKKYLELLDMYS